MQPIIDLSILACFLILIESLLSYHYLIPIQTLHLISLRFLYHGLNLLFRQFAETFVKKDPTEDGEDVAHAEEHCVAFLCF